MNNLEGESLRPVYLEIEGLHSFKTRQEIDFYKLGETGLFGIFGPTGSGKSTILDAITLALYGNVQRAVRGTQGIINTTADFVRVCFTFDLVRNDAKKRYRVERIYKRKKDSDTSVETKSARLFEIREDQNIPLVDKPGEVTARVEELLGLQLDDFTRTVVLPQNKFHEFLLLEKAKKRDMLEKIFFLEEYGRQLVDRVSKRMSSVKIRLASLEGAISSLGECSEKVLMEAEIRLKQAKEQRDRIDVQMKQMEDRFHEAKEVWSLSEEYSHIVEAERQHHLRQKEMDEKRTILECAQKAAGLAGAIAKYREGKKQLADTDVLLSVTVENMEKTEERLQNARIVHSQCREASDKEQPVLIERRTKLGEALLVKNEIAALDTVLQRLRERYTELKQQITALDKTIESIKLALAEIEKERGECKKELELLKVDAGYRSVIQKGARMQDELQGLEVERSKLEEKHKELCSKVIELQKTEARLEEEGAAVKALLDQLKLQEEAHRTQCPEDRALVLEEIEHLHAFRAVLASLEMVGRDSGMLEARIADICKQTDLYTGKLAGTQQSLEELRTLLVQLREKELQVKHLCDMDAAFVLAQTLIEGEPCPVCGSAHHPAPAIRTGDTEQGRSSDELKSIREEIAAVEGRYRECEAESIRLLEQMKTLKERHAAAEEELAAKRREYGTLLEKLPENMRTMELPAIRAALEKTEIRNQEQLKAIEQWEQTSEDIRKRMVKANEMMAGHKEREAAVKTELSVHGAALGELEHSLNDLDGRRSDKLKEYQAFLQQNRIDDAHMELKRLSNRDVEHEKCQKRMEQLESKEKDRRNELDLLIAQRQQLYSSFDEVRVEGEALKRQRSEKEQKIVEVAGDKDVAEAIRTVESALEALAVREKEASELVRALEASFNDLHTQRKTLENQRKIFNDAVEEDGLRLEKALKENGFSGIEAAEQCMIPLEQKESIDREIKEYERIQRNLEAQREMLVKRLAGRNISEEEWRRINEEYLQKQQEKEQCIERMEEAKNSFASIRKNFDIWVKLHGELVEHRRKLELLEQIQKLLKGNSFVEYILEERLRYIAREASETLGVLTKYKYSLELDAENGFVIRDNSNGGVHRPVNSLSGGETFLTSLSLALALSKQIQLKGQSPLEFFFLDEGFGTLDSDLLDNVMDSLGRLSTGERVIGLISHVPELRNRMTRRLIVDPPSADGQGSRVRIEKA